MTNKRAILKPLTMIVVHTMMLSVYNIRRFKKHSKHIYEPTSHIHIHDYIWQPASAILKAHESFNYIFCLFNVLGCMMNKNLKCFNSFFTNVVSLSLYMIQTRKLVQQRLYHLYFLAFVSLFLLVVECCSSRLKESEGLKELGLVGACKFCYDGSHGLFIPWQIFLLHFIFLFWLSLSLLESKLSYAMEIELWVL